MNLTIFFFSGVAMHERMRYYIRNTRIMQGIEGYEHAGNPETRLARLHFPLVQPDDVCASEGFHQSHPPIPKQVAVTLVGLQFTQNSTGLAVPAAGFLFDARLRAVLRPLPYRLLRGRNFCLARHHFTSQRNRSPSRLLPWV